MKKRQGTSVKKKKFDLTALIVISAAVCIGIILLIIYWLLIPLRSQSDVLATSAGPPVSPSGYAITATDSFQRANQTYWGTASDGQTWGGGVNTSNEFSIANSNGQEFNSSGGTYVGTLGPQLTNAEIYTTVKSTSYANSNNVGALARYTDNNNFYYAWLTNSGLQIKKKVNGSITQLSSDGSNPSPNVTYSLRFRVNGSNLYAKYWQYGTVEPGSWSTQTIDTDLSGFGSVGIRTQQQTGQTFTFSYFQAYNVNLALTPTPTPIPRYTCDGNTGACVQNPQGYYTTSNCNYACWGNQLPTPTPMSPSCSGISGNLIADCSFESSANFPSPWLFQFTPGSDGAGSIQQDNSQGNVTDGHYSAKLNETSGSVDYYVQLIQSGMPVTMGHTYKVTFDAKAASARTITVYNQQYVPPYSVLNGNTTSLTTNWQIFSYTFVASASYPNTSLAFNIGTNTASVWVDNVSMADTGALVSTPTPTPSPIPLLTPTPTLPPILTPTPTVDVSSQNNQQNNSQNQQYSQNLQSDMTGTSPTPFPTDIYQTNTVTPIPQQQSLLSSLINLINPNKQPPQQTQENTPKNSGNASIIYGEFVTPTVPPLQVIVHQDSWLNIFKNFSIPGFILGINDGIKNFFSQLFHINPRTL